MNKKLLCSTALAGAMIVSGSAVAELKVGGNFTHITAFGSDKASGSPTGSDNRLGTEMNVTLSSRADLSNGLYAQYKANVEFDDGTAPDVEYEFQIGTKQFYIGLGSDAGNNISGTPTLPAVGYFVGTLAQMTSKSTPLNLDGLLNAQEANDITHVSANLNVAGGTASIVYAPHSSEVDDDADLITAATGGSRIAYLYQGKPIDNVTVIAGQTTLTGSNSTTADIKNKKWGVAYNFGQIQAGYEWQKYTDGTAANEERADNYAITYKASDQLTLGVQYSEAKKPNGAAGSTKEKITAVSAGYNLGAVSIALSLVDTENLGGTTTAGVDSQGAVIVTKMAF